MKFNKIKFLLSLFILPSFLFLNDLEFFAQSQKGFHDKLILKNGNAYTDVKVTQINETFVMTKKDGETIILNKIDILKVIYETKTEAYKEKLDRVITDPKLESSWSEYQGRLFYNQAKEKCEDFGMRLPTRGEFELALSAGIMKQWKDVGFFTGFHYWALSESDDNVATIFGPSGEVVTGYKFIMRPTRCIR